MMIILLISILLELPSIKYYKQPWTRKLQTKSASNFIQYKKKKKKKKKKIIITKKKKKKKKKRSYSKTSKQIYCKQEITQIVMQ